MEGRFRRASVVHLRPCVYPRVTAVIITTHYPRDLGEWECMCYSWRKSPALCVIMWKLRVSNVPALLWKLFNCAAMLHQGSFWMGCAGREKENEKNKKQELGKHVAPRCVFCSRPCGRFQSSSSHAVIPFSRVRQHGQNLSNFHGFHVPQLVRYCPWTWSNI